MILIADGGSTKADWICLDTSGNQVFKTRTNGLNPEKYGVIKDTEEIGTFANNDINFVDSTGIDHNQFSFGLKKSLYNFMHGICLDYPLQDWFDFKIIFYFNSFSLSFFSFLTSCRK